MFFIEYAIERSKAEILHDMEHGPLPRTVSSFSELHDHVDANEYGGLCDSGSWWCMPDDATDKELAENDGFFLRHWDQGAAVQDAVDAWLRERALTLVICTMANCSNEMSSITGDHTIYSARLTRTIPCCADCYEDHEDLMAYGRPDYGAAWLKHTEDLLIEANDA